MQIMHYCTLPFEFAGEPNFNLLCDEEVGAVLNFTARLGLQNDWSFVRSSINLSTGLVRFFSGELEGYEAYENFLGVKIDHEAILGLATLNNHVEINNQTDFEINHPDQMNSYSLAKICNSNWVAEINAQFDRYHSLKGYSGQREIEREHLVLFSSQCFVEFIATDPWQVNIGSETKLS